MTFSERTEDGSTTACDTLTGCGTAIREDRAFSEPLSRVDEVVVFKLDKSTGRYDMATACCEAVLPPLK